jgi:hypothetical protein
MSRISALKLPFQARLLCTLFVSHNSNEELLNLPLSVLSGMHRAYMVIIHFSVPMHRQTSELLNVQMRVHNDGKSHHRPTYLLFSAVLVSEKYIASLPRKN